MIGVGYEASWYQVQLVCTCGFESDVMHTLIPNPALRLTYKRTRSQLWNQLLELSKHEEHARA